MYSHGNYVGAAEYFEHTQARLDSAPADERARYGLYRGVTLLTLGDLEAADHWFSYAAQVVERHPHALDAEESRMLQRALRVRATVARAGARDAAQRHAAND